MTSDSSVSRRELPGERWRRVGLALARKARLGRPWFALTQQLLARTALGVKRWAGRGPAGHETAGSNPSGRPLSLAPAARESASLSETSHLRDTAGVSAGSAEAPRKLDRHLQNLLSQVLNLRLPSIRVRTDSVADLLARRHRADALVSGGEIHFRRGAFDPASTKGRALIAHEAVHLAWAQGLRPAQASTSAVNQAELEEQMALEVEKRVLRHQTLLTTGARGSAPAVAARMPEVAAPRPGASGPVKTALTGRTFDAESTASAATATLSEGQLQSLKEDLYRTLLDRLRSEFERGG